MERNNIFNFATSELSQDAFICWCLNWLNYKDSELRDLAADLLKAFGEESISDNQEIIIKRQFKKVDILVVLKELNRVYIIEDKVNSSERKKQLEEYETKIKELNENEKNYLECKAESHWDWNIVKSNIAQYCFFKEIFSEERIVSFRNKGNGSAVSQYNLLGKRLPIFETSERYLIFWRMDNTKKEGPYLRLNFYHKYDKENESLKYTRKEKYEIVYKKIYKVIKEHKSELTKINNIEENCKYKDDYEIPILHINLKEYIKAGKDEMDKLMDEVKKLHGYLQNVNFE